MNRIYFKSLMIFLSLFLLSSSHLFASFEYSLDLKSSSVLELSNNESNEDNPSADSSRAMYVDDFFDILGSDSLENDLLSFAQSHQIKTLLLYDLHLVHNAYNLTNPATNVILADFISKAKTSYGLLNIGATSENGDYFTNVIDVYNNSRSAAEEKFDIYNLEFEFWIDTPVNPGGYYCDNYLIPNGLPCSNSGGFLFFISALQTMNNLASNNSHPISVEAYIGWPTASQIDSIGDNLDRLRLHAYVSDPSTSFSYAQQRLIDYSTAHPNVDVSIIFSAEPVFMGPWLQSNSMTSAEEIFTTDWISTSAGWPSNVNLEGFTYYNFSDLSDVPFENCPSNVELKDLTLDKDSTIYASCIIELSNVIVDSAYHLTLIAPEVVISTDCNIDEAASVTLIGEDGCVEE